MVKEVLKRITSEFKLKHFKFDHEQPDEFYRSQWQHADCSYKYLYYRLVVLCFYLAVWLSVVLLEWHGGKMFIYLTNIGFTLCTLTQLLGTVTLLMWTLNYRDLRRNIMNHKYSGSLATTYISPLPQRAALKSHQAAVEISRMPMCAKFYWFFFSVSINMAFVVSLIYWTFLYGKMDKPDEFPVLSFLVHCSNSAFLLLDLAVGAFPIRLLHVVYNMAVSICYAIFSVLYHLFDGTDEYGKPYIYPILDWRRPKDALITILGVIVLYIIFYVIIFLIFVIRRAIYNRWFAKEKQIESI